MPGFYDTTIVSPKNYFLFTPLLPSTTVGTLEPQALVESIRKIVKSCDGAFLCGEAIEIDPARKLVHCVGIDGKPFDLEYDLLVVAVGAEVNTFGIKGVKEYTNQLKTVSDARSIRKRIIKNCEIACLPTIRDDERKRLLHFVVVGGGPTGVEFAAELYDFIHEDLVKVIAPPIFSHMAVSLIQNADHILNTYDLKISNYTENLFRREGIQVITNAE